MDNNDNYKPVKILLVEDNPSDVRMIGEVLKDYKRKTQIYNVTDGKEALNFLNKKGKYKNTFHPDFIVLDLNLPRENGIGLLNKIKKDVNLKDIPLIILTTSAVHEDILKACEFKARYFIIKPMAFDEYKKILQNIEEYCQIKKINAKKKLNISSISSPKK